MHQGIHSEHSTVVYNTLGCAKYLIKQDIVVDTIDIVVFMVTAVMKRK